jgi:hypothetical protein
MKSIKFHGANLTLKKPRNWDEERDGECSDLSVRAVDGQFTSVWAPSMEERLAIAAGQNVVLNIASSKHPAVMLTVADIQPIEPDISNLSPSEIQVLRTIDELGTGIDFGSRSGLRRLRSAVEKLGVRGLTNGDYHDCRVTPLGIKAINKLLASPVSS